MYKKSEKKLSKMKGLKNEGRASQKAVDLAITQVALAVAGVGMATVNVVRAAQNAAIAAETSLGTGMYAAGYVDTTHHTDFLKTNTEQSAHRGGSFAQDLWESNSIVNNYQNLNQITANQYNQIYNSSNNQDIAIGNEVSYVQHVYDNENVNDYLYLMDRKIPFTEWARTKDVEDFDLNFGVQGVVTRVYASFGTDGFSVGADLNPSVGIGVYSNIVPRGENVEYSVVFGFKNSLTGSAGTIITDKGNFGITGSYGLSIPFYPIPTNVSRTIPLDKLKQDSK